MAQIPKKLPCTFGHYTLVRQVSKGGMSLVYEGRREAIAGVSARVAIKIMRPELAENETHKNLFIQEAKNASSLMHRNIVHTQDFEEVDGLLMLIMEYVEGLTVREMMRQAHQHGLPIPPHVIAEVGRQICDGLHHAHCAADPRGKPMGLVHCDVKPGNLIVNNQGALKVLDFGLSKTATEQFNNSVTRGTWGYMAPEQVKGSTLVPRTDIYALAIVLYEMAASRQMFRRHEKKDFNKICELMNSDEPIKRVMKLGGPYKRLQEVLIRALQRDPSARYSTAQEMGRELGKLVADPVIAQQDLITLLSELQKMRKSGGRGSFVSPLQERDQTDFSGQAFQPRHRERKNRKRSALLMLLLLPLLLVGTLFGLKQFYFAPSDPPEQQPVQMEQKPKDLEIIEGTPGEGEFEKMPPPKKKKTVKPKPKPKVEEVEDVRIIPPKEPEKEQVVENNTDLSTPALVTISADISAKIFIDGKLIGAAPVIRRSLRPGEYRIHVAPNTGVIKKFTIKVQPGKEFIYQWSFNDERWLHKGER